jgi:hypothetical protein
MEHRILICSGSPFDTKGDGYWDSDLVRTNAQLDLELNQPGRKPTRVKRERQTM